MFPLIVAVLTVLTLLFLFPTSQELIHWLVLVRIRVSISKSDVDDGVSLAFPRALDENFTSCLQAPPLP